MENQDDEALEWKRTRRFQVEAPNSYESDASGKKIVQIKLLEVLFLEQVCTLVFMQDLTKFVKDKEEDQST